MSTHLKLALAFGILSSIPLPARADLIIFSQFDWSLLRRRFHRGQWGPFRGKKDRMRCIQDIVHSYLSATIGSVRAARRAGR